MLQVTARVFKDNQLVGYNVTDGQMEQTITKTQAWIFAKDKQLFNVVATGDEFNPGISGTNGLELKRLPKIKYNDKSQKLVFTSGDLTAARLRHDIMTGKQSSAGVGSDQLKEMEKNFLKEDIQSGVVLKETCRALSDSLVIRSLLIDKYNPGSMTLLVIGYEVLNVGSQAIDITRMTCTPDHSTTQARLEPTQAMYLNRAEVSILSSKPEVGCTFNNAKQVGSSRRQYDSMYDYLASRYVIADKGGTGEISRKDIQDVESVENISKYFIPDYTTRSKVDERGDVIMDNVGKSIAQKYATVIAEEAAQKAVNNLKKKGIMAGFKR